MSKCQCGYECRFPGEQEALDKWGCARAMETRQQPFNNLSVTMCSRETGAPLLEEPEDGQAFADAFKQKYIKPTNDADRTSKS